MKRFRTLLWVAIGVPAIAVPHVAAARALVDRIVAVIDRDVITLRELRQKYASALKETAAEQDEVVLRRVLEQEITERLIERELVENRQKLGVSEQDVDHAVAEVLRLNKMTEEQLRSVLYGQAMTWKEYRQKLRSQIERARLIQTKVQGRVQVSEQDVRDRCAQALAQDTGTMRICASHILRQVSADAHVDDAAVEKARTELVTLRQRLAEGATFTQVAQESSDDHGSADGALGCFGPGEMVEPFENAAMTASIGVVSEPVRTPFGWHLILVHERGRSRPTSVRCDDPAELQHHQEALGQEVFERQMLQWEASLRSKTYVDIRL